MFVAGSSDDPQLLHQLDQEFRRILSSKVIVEGEKSLDFLLGMLVYIAWYPIQCKPKDNQTFMYMSLAISLASDLKLDQGSPNSSDLTNVEIEGLVEDGMFTPMARRASLACYYLSSALSQGFQKPTNLHYRNLLASHGEFLVKDRAIKCSGAELFRLQYLAERICELWKSSPPEGYDAAMISLNAELNIQMFKQDLQEWRVIATEETKALSFIGLAERFVNITIYSHALGLLRRPYREHLKSPQNDHPPVRTHLMQCLEACKIYFQRLLSLLESDYTRFTIVQWGYTVQAVLVLSRLTFLMASNLCWDSNTTRANVPLVMYLDALCYRFHSLSTTPSSNESIPPRNSDPLYIAKMMFGSVKKSYEKRVAAITPGKDSRIAQGQFPINDPSIRVFLEGIDDYWNSVLAGSGNESQNVAAAAGTAPPPSFHDLWATMTGTWAHGS